MQLVHIYVCTINQLYAIDNNEQHVCESPFDVNWCQYSYTSAIWNRLHSKGREAIALVSCLCEDG